jgi:hypothetical protein
MIKKDPVSLVLCLHGWGLYAGPWEGNDCASAILSPRTAEADIHQPKGYAKTTKRRKDGALVVIIHRPHVSPKRCCNQMIADEMGWK